MKKEDITEKEINWHRSDLFYQKLYYLEMAISQRIFEKDMEGWYFCLEEEYRFVWPHIQRMASENNHTKEFFESKWQKVRDLLYDRRLQKNNTRSQRICLINRSIIRHILHELNMLLNQYEVAANLRITENEKSNPYKAAMQYGN